MSDDVAAKLREQLLLSKKTKRRAPPTLQTPALGNDPGSVSLTYDEPAKSAALAPAAPIAIKIDSTNSIEMEDGEISDSPGDENLSASVNVRQIDPPKASSKTSLPSRQASQKPIRKSTTTPPHSNVLERASKSPLQPSAPPQDSKVDVEMSDLLPETQQKPGTPGASVVVTERLPSPAALALLRSQLNLNDDELFEAKVVILDILGWGIPPQYLLDCGISDLAVVVCLAQLKLRIPQELEPLIDDAERRTRAPSNSPSIPHLTTPSPPTPSLNGLPPKPLENHTAVETSDPVATLKPPRSTNTPTNDLVDMEQQRKQELLARRAALQSMKRNHETMLNGNTPSHTSSPPSRPEPITETLPYEVASNTQEVDAFLADLIPQGEDTLMQDGDHDSSGEVERELDFDEQSFARPSSAQKSPPYLDPSPDSALTNGVSNEAASFSNGPSSLDLLDPASNMYQRSDLTLPSHGNSKRQGKRPVAADFSMDYNPAAEPQHGPASYPPFGGSSRPVPDTSSYGNYRRRPHFGPRIQERLVINLSDEEEVSDEEADSGPPPSKPPPSASATLANEPLRERSATPSALDDEKHRHLLHKKQAEIELMKERIRAMEEKKKKLTLPIIAGEEISQGGTPEPITTTTPTPTSAQPNVLSPPALDGTVVKTEEPDEMSLDVVWEKPATLDVVRSSSSQPPSVPNGKSTETRDGDHETTNGDISLTGANVVEAPSPTPNAPNFVDLPETDEPFPSSSYNPYVSPFFLYPCLELVLMSAQTSPAPLTASSTPTALSSTSSFSFLLKQLQQVDLRVLRASLAASSIDPQRVLCAYEISAGACRDTDCPDLHLKDVQDAEDKIIAEFLAPLLQSSKREQIQSALATTRQRPQYTYSTPSDGKTDGFSDPLRRQLIDAALRLSSLDHNS